MTYYEKFTQITQGNGAAATVTGRLYYLRRCLLHLAQDQHPKKKKVKWAILQRQCLFSLLFCVRGCDSLFIRTLVKTDPEVRENVAARQRLVTAGLSSRDGTTYFRIMSLAQTGYLQDCGRLSGF